MKGVKIKMELSPEQREELLKALKGRFEKNMNRHKGFEFLEVGEVCRLEELLSDPCRLGN